MNTGTASAADKEAPTGRLSSVTSALLVLKAFSAEEAEIGISSLAKRLGLAKSTVHRLAVTLAAEGFLEQNPETGRYRLGLSLFTLGALARRRMDVSNVSRPLLGVLRDKFRRPPRWPYFRARPSCTCTTWKAGRPSASAPTSATSSPRSAPPKAVCCWPSARPAWWPKC
jgi:hypothetical protein